MNRSRHFEHVGRVLALGALLWAAGGGQAFHAQFHQHTHAAGAARWGEGAGRGAVTAAPTAAHACPICSFLAGFHSTPGHPPTAAAAAPRGLTRPAENPAPEERTECASRCRGPPAGLPESRLS